MMTPTTDWIPNEVDKSGNVIEWLCFACSGGPCYDDVKVCPNGYREMKK